MADEPVSDFDLGFHSNHWLLKALVANADPGMLRYGVSSMINYWVYNESPDIETAFDVLAQITANGVYYPTYEHFCEEGDSHANPDLDPTRQGGEERETVNPLSPEEQDDIVAQFRATLGIVPETNPEEEENN